MLSTEEEENFLRLLTSGDLANVNLAFQLQASLQSPAFERKVAVYKKLLPLFRYLDTSDVVQSIAQVGDLSLIKELSLEDWKGEYTESTLPDEIGELVHLQTLYIGRFSRLEALPDVLCTLPYLEKITINDVPLHKLPDHLGDCTCLKELLVFDVPLRYLPQNIGKANRLEKLVLDGTNIKQLPVSVGKWANLVYFECVNTPLRSLPKEIGKWQNLAELKLEALPLKNLPDVWADLGKLKKVTLKQHDNLKSLPKSFYRLPALERLELENNGIKLSQDIKHWQSLENLRLINTSIKTLPASIGELPKLTTLYIERAPQLKTLPTSIGESPSLENLTIDEVPIQHLNLRNPQNSPLRYLRLKFNKIANFPTCLAKLPRLERLEIASQPNLKALSKTIGKLQSLRELSISNIPNLRLPATLGKLAHLKVLTLSSLNLQKLPIGIGELANLTVLNMGYNALNTLPETLNTLQNLTHLSLHYNQFSELPQVLAHLTSLNIVSFHHNIFETFPEEATTYSFLETLHLDSNPFLNKPKEKKKAEEAQKQVRYIDIEDLPF